ncbi:catalase family peroxidase [Paenibacillus herberti]|uniref:Catalase-related peroxidase n=1 Tax=Paenibacillus herberti TaxID=1619309 RepID=A0A229NUU8_9BACL|nr:catalase family peroxidase [Paenibacillus herberti]OXM13600.1 catalase [Paenibacillus herberti]
MTNMQEPMPASDKLPARSVDAIEELSGTHPGKRRAHARGICAKGVFTPSGQAARLTFAAHLQQTPCEAIIRFSNSAADPASRDLMSPAKGMALQFQLPDGQGARGVESVQGEKPVISAVTAPVFVARTPESFLEMMLAARDMTRRGDSIKDRLKGMLQLFPHAAEALTSISSLKPPASFASVPYYSIHAFYFVDENGRRRPVKYEWIPDAEEAHLPLIKAAVSSKDYLEDELRDRLGTSPIGFTLRLTLGEEWDPVDDCTARWPSNRETLEAGHLFIVELIEEPDGLVMDPTVTGPGIELTPDPILNFRHDAYAVSFERRQKGI